MHNDAAESVLDSTTVMVLTMLFNGNDYISNPEDLADMLDVLDFAGQMKDMANAAMFSVTELVIDMGLDYIRYKDTGANATYSLSAKVEDTRFMNLE
jgi:hypothetical protein